MKKNNYATELQKLLLSKEEYLLSDDDERKELNKVKVSSLARNFDKDLLKLLESNKIVKDQLFVNIKDGVVAFKLDNFLTFINNREFLPDSYTAYKNKIGLATDKDNYLDNTGNVVLNWPYKDCILEGGQDKEDQKRSEVFFNEVLAPDQINRLLDDKVFTNWQRYDKDGKMPLDKLNETDNLIIKGNNLIVLHSLLKRFAGKVKLIYIDPPYNTGNDGFNYNDHFNHSTWLTFMKNRLEVAKHLLSDDGSIFIQLDNNEVHYCKVLMDEIFGRQNFQREIIWRLDGLAGYKSLINNFVRGHETILFYSKKQNFKFNKQYLPYNEEQIKRFSSVDENGRKYKTLEGDRRLYLEDAKGIPLSDVWSDIASFQTVVNAPEIIKNFIGQKPEKLIERVITSITDENDIILDYHLGTGTTCAVAHKLKRQYIGIEQLNYGKDDPIERLKKVVEGEQGGISKNVNWTGGGSFVYAEIKNDAEDFKTEVKKAGSNKLNELLEKAKNSSFLSWRVNRNELNNWNDLTDDDKKRILCELVDNNTLYVNYSDIENSDYDISASDKKFNKEFYEV